MPERTILRVVVPAPLHRVFDYTLPRNAAPGVWRRGMRLRVPFGRRTVTGLLWGVSNDTAISRARLRSALDIIDAEPLLAEPDLKLLSWASDYYQHPLGEVVFATLPAIPRRGKRVPDLAQSGWRLTELGRSVDPAGLTRAPRQAAVLTVMRDAANGLGQQILYDRLGPCRDVLRSLQAKAWIEVCVIEASDHQRSVLPAAAPSLNLGQQGAVDVSVRPWADFRRSFWKGSRAAARPRSI